jgi:hypothetical protein
MPHKQRIKSVVVTMNPIAYIVETSKTCEFLLEVCFSVDLDGMCSGVHFFHHLGPSSFGVSSINLHPLNIICHTVDIHVPEVSLDMDKPIGRCWI